MAWHFDASNIDSEPVSKQAGGSFHGLGIAPKILETLSKLSFTVPTPIQHKAIPLGIEGKDLIGVAQTGTGKTLAFAIPVIQRLAQGKGRCLVLLPTRELAIQVDETFRKLAPIFNIKTAVIIGGASMGLQIQALKKGPRVIIATPGRLVDHMERCTIMLADVNVLVLDEADRMLDMGFMPSIERILKALPRERQTLLFSATIPPEIMKIATTQMKLPMSIEVSPSGTTADKIVQEVFIVRKESKRQLLEKILEQYKGSVLLFTRTRIGANKTTRLIRDMGHKAAEIHSDRTLGQRKEALEGFKSGRYRVLVATDIAARGIDVAGIELVINYDLPEESENYVHRIGRTARAGQEGRAISFATPDQGQDVKSIERLIKIPLPISEHPELPKETFDYSASSSSRGGYGGGRSRFGGGGGARHGGGHGGHGGAGRHSGAGSHGGHGGGFGKRPGGSHGGGHGGSSHGGGAARHGASRYGGGHSGHSRPTESNTSGNASRHGASRPSGASRFSRGGERSQSQGQSQSGGYASRRTYGQGLSFKPAEKKSNFSSSREHSLRHENVQSYDRPRREHKPEGGHGHKPTYGGQSSQSSHGRFPSNLPFAKFRRDRPK